MYCKVLYSHLLLVPSVYWWLLLIPFRKSLLEGSVSLWSWHARGRSFVPSYTRIHEIGYAQWRAGHRVRYYYSWSLQVESSKIQSSSATAISRFSSLFASSYHGSPGLPNKNNSGVWWRLIKLGGPIRRSLLSRSSRTSRLQPHPLPAVVLCFFGMKQHHVMVRCKEDTRFRQGIEWALSKPRIRQTEASTLYGWPSLKNTLIYYCLFEASRFKKRNTRPPFIVFYLLLHWRRLKALEELIGRRFKFEIYYISSSPCPSLSRIRLHLRISSTRALG